MFRNKPLLIIVRGAVIAALYVVLTLPFAVISFGVLQVRLSEMLTIAPFFWPEAIPGLAVGCLVANIIGSPFGLVDWIFGTLATLTAAWLTFLLSKTGKLWIAAIPPVVINALIVGAYLSVLLGFLGPETPPMPTGFEGFSAVINSFQFSGYMITAGYIAFGQILAVSGLGLPLAYGLRKAGLVGNGR
jgi:uncharacterized membrane protein